MCIKPTGCFSFQNVWEFEVLILYTHSTIIRSHPPPHSHISTLWTMDKKRRTYGVWHTQTWADVEKVWIALPHEFPVWIGAVFGWWCVCVYGLALLALQVRFGVWFVAMNHDRSLWKKAEEKRNKQKIWEKNEEANNQTVTWVCTCKRHHLYYT